mmetsp:Transcript_36100/g.32486  ORF Transcript_36100/g.32486 Transcript_36100/m.32486 type:complete len:213 (+) Transcript_36100:162-800(+)
MIRIKFKFHLLPLNTSLIPIIIQNRCTSTPKESRERALSSKLQETLFNLLEKLNLILIISILIRKVNKVSRRAVLSPSHRKISPLISPNGPNQPENVTLHLRFVQFLDQKGNSFLDLALRDGIFHVSEGFLVVSLLIFIPGDTSKSLECLINNVRVEPCVDAGASQPKEDISEEGSVKGGLCLLLGDRFGCLNTNFGVCDHKAFVVLFVKSD